jgi:hypothetical protein
MIQPVAWAAQEAPQKQHLSEGWWHEFYNLLKTKDATP